MGVKQKCGTCGAVFELNEIKLICRDKDDLSCSECGAELISWNGGVCYSIIRLLAPGQKPNQAKTP